MGHRDAESRASVNSQRQQAEHKVAHMVFPVCAYLEVLTIGNNTKCTVERDLYDCVERISVWQGDRDKIVNRSRF